LNFLLKICFWTFLFIVCNNVYSQCNGAIDLCNRRYNEVAYLTTHNAYNSNENSFSLPNQTWGLSRQLQDGVRALMIDVYNVAGVPTVYHGYSMLGSAPLMSNLLEIKSFLDNNPNDIITIIFECYTSANAIENDMVQSGLLSYVFEKEASEPWPTLQNMIDNGKRLLVFSDKNDANTSQKWYHYVWHHATETHFSVSDTASFNCNFNRGNPLNDLYIFNHFITNNYGVGVPSQAEIANSNPFFINRIVNCWQTHNKFPNFITVDFYEKGNCTDVVDALNSNILWSANAISSKNDNIVVFPNPISDNAYLYVPNALKPPFMYQLFNSIGVLVTEKVAFFEKISELNIENLSSGIYILKFKDKNDTVKHLSIYIN